MTDNDIPMWALNKAALFASFGTEKDAATFYGASHPTVLSIRAHAALIAKHEQPPVGPEEDEAKALAAEIGWNFAWEAVLAGIKHGRLQREKEGNRA